MVSPSIAIAMTHRVDAGFDPLTDISGLILLALSKDSSATGAHSGTGDSFTLAGSTITLADSANPFSADDDELYITITGATTSGNNGTFRIASVPGAGSVTYTNASGATEAFSGTWRIHGRGADFSDRVGPYSFTQATTANRFPVRDNFIGSHRVFACVSTNTRKWFENTSSALYSAGEGAPAMTMGVYAYIVTHPGSDLDLHGFANTGTSYVPCVQLGMNASGGSGLQYREVDSGSTVYQDTTAVSGAWKLLSAVSDGAGSVGLYDGTTLLATASGSHRNPTGLGAYVLGENVSTTTAREVYIGGYFTATGDASAHFADLKTWFDGEYA